MLDEENVSTWQAVTGRALAYLCLQSGDRKDKSLTEQAKFLQGLGLSTTDAAALLNTTAASIRELLSRAKRGKQSKRNESGKQKKKTAHRTRK